MSLDVFGALAQGYQDRLIDQQSHAAQIGYWCGYYVLNKNQKPIDVITKTMADMKYSKAQTVGPQKRMETVDVEEFERREKMRRSTFDKWRVD